MQYQINPPHSGSDTSSNDESEHTDDGSTLTVATSSELWTDIFRKLILASFSKWKKFTTHTPKLQTAKRKGVWFTKNSMEKWLSRLGLPRVNYHHARTSTSGSSADPASPQHKESKENSNQIPHDTTRNKLKRHLSESSNDTPNLRSEPTGRVTKRGKSHVSEENDW